MGGRLDGRIAVVTGGGAGIGQAIAAKLAAEGADIAVPDIGSFDETKGIVESLGRRFFGAACDTSSEEQVNAFAADVEKALGPVDIVVNNAAVAYVKSFEDTTPELLTQMLAINVVGYFQVIKAFYGQLKQSKAGRVINMASSSYWEAPPMFSAYVTTKGAVNGMTHTLATDLAKDNITVNAIAPSLIRTPTTRRELPPGFFEAHAEHQNLKRVQTPEDVANTIAFLASDEAAFITGQIMLVDGGLRRR